MRSGPTSSFEGGAGSGGMGQCVEEEMILPGGGRVCMGGSGMWPLRGLQVLRHRSSLSPE